MKANSKVCITINVEDRLANSSLERIVQQY